LRERTGRVAKKIDALSISAIQFPVRGAQSAGGGSVQGLFSSPEGRPMEDESTPGGAAIGKVGLIHNKKATRRLGELGFSGSRCRGIREGGDRWEQGGNASGEMGA